MVLTEYATVGYMAKRIQMRKNRIQALQKMAEQKKKEMQEQLDKQTVCTKDNHYLWKL